jgi:hypothetical protein
LTEWELYEATKFRDATLLHPVAFVLFIITVFLILTLSREKVLIPFLFMVIIIPYSQRIAIFGLDFFLSRLLVLIGILRIIIQREIVFENKIDKRLALMFVCYLIARILLWQNIAMTVRSVGVIIDFFGSYILIRSLLRNIEDFNRMFKTLIVITVIIAASMIYEQITGKNIFYIFGGVPESTFIRDGGYRSQASFGHPILAGCFGATLFPIYYYMLKEKAVSIVISIIALIACITITITASSSGPVLAFIAGTGSLLLFNYRKYMKHIRWTALLLVLSLHIVMQAPVWALIGRAAIFGSSTAYHRFLLVDNFIRRFGEWWIIGVKETGHWHEHISTWDIANYYVHVGVEGGLATFIMLISVIVSCYSTIGKGLRVFSNNSERLFLYWAIGSAFTAHLVAFWGVSYFTQMVFMWSFILAVISSAHDIAVDKEKHLNNL